MSKFYINPGHGGSDSGAIGINGREEKVDALKYASKVAELLKSAGHVVKLERDGDYLINVKDIAAKANAWGADYFIAFHRNAGGGTGAECLIVSSASAKSREIAQAIQNALVAVGFKNRGVKVQDRNTYVLSHTTMPATTIECGFVDSQTDNDLFDSKLDEICNGIANAILSATVGGSVSGGGTESGGSSSGGSTGGSGYTKKAFSLDHVVKKGSKEAVVGSIQNNLLAMGYDLGSTGIDNNFGTKTDAAVRDVQKNGGVSVDGQVGKNTTPLLGGTWTGSGSSSSGSSSSSSIPKLTRNLKLTSPMMKGDDVKQAQQRLQKHLANPGKIDGVFGSDTKAAVIRFQKARIAEGRDLGSTGADGVIGQKTWAILWE